MDSICSLLVNRIADGRLDYDKVNENLSRAMMDFRVRIGNSSVAAIPKGKMLADGKKLNFLMLGVSLCSA